MRVCVMGETSPPHDEGMKKAAFALARALSAHCAVRTLDPLAAGGVDFWRPLLDQRPDIVHYVPGPSLRSLGLLALVKRLTGAATVVSLTHPDPALPWRAARWLLAPDLLLSQSLPLERRLRALGYRVTCVPNGVDTDLFCPVTMAEKVRLRLKYDLPGDAFIVLHVGNTRRIRNLEALAAVQGDGCQVLVVSSTTIRGDRGVRERLERAGCLVWNHYVASIQEVYALADCYVFPTLTETAAIDHPLSVLEAMACNLPVVTRRFGALPRVFAPGEGLYFVDTAGDLARAVQEVRRSEPPVATRAQVMGLDWRAIADQIAALYRELAPAPCAQQHGRRRPFGGLR